MSDLIDRQAAIDAVMNTEPVFDGGGKTYQATADVISALTGLPSAHPLDPCETCLHKGKGWDEDPCDGCTGTESKYEPERKKGEWEKCGRLEGKVVMRCSNCGQGITAMFSPEYHYCPNCGADMRGEE